MIYWPTKAPAAIIDYGANWAPALSRLGDVTITNSVWSRVSGDAVVGTQNHTATTTSVRISGGTDGTDSVFENVVTLSDGQVLDKKALLKVRL